jgi:hypothetical protein
LAYIKAIVLAWIFSCISGSAYLVGSAGNALTEFSCLLRSSPPPLVELFAILFIQRTNHTEVVMLVPTMCRRRLDLGFSY